MTNNNTYKRPVIVWGNSFYINISLEKFNEGTYTDLDLTKVTDLKVYLICATHNTEIPLDYEIIPGIDNILRCFVDYRLLHTTSYGIVVEGYDEHDIHFRFSMLPKEGFLVVNNTSGMEITDEVQTIDISGRVGWGIQTDGDLTNYYTKTQIDNMIAEIEVEIGDTYTKEEINQLLTQYPTKTEINTRFNNYYTKQDTNSLLDNKQDELVSGQNIKTINNQSLLGSGNIVIEGTEQLQADWTQTDTSAKDYIKHKPIIPAAQVNSDWNATSGVAKILNKPDLSIYATEQELDNYYNKNTVDNLLDAKANTSDLATVATSGSYNDLSNKPDLTQYATHTELNTKQDTLVSGTNIKTLNNTSLLGAGNIEIEAENNDEVTANALYELNSRLSETEFNVNLIPGEIDGKIVPINEKIDTIEEDLSDDINDLDDSNLSNSLILNKLHDEIDEKQDELVSGTNIKTVNGNSLLGSGNIAIGDANNLVYYGNIKKGYEPHTQSNYTVMTTDSIKSQAIYGDNLYYGINPEIYEEFNLDKVSSGNTEAHYSYNGYNEDSRVINKVYINGGNYSQYIYNDEWEAVDTWPSWVTRWQDPQTQQYPYGVYKTLSSLGNIYKTKNGSTAFDDIFIENTASYSNIIVTLIFEEYDGHYANVKTEINKKQNLLISGTNIKTVNGTSLLGSGDITIGGSSDPYYYIDIDWQSTPQDSTWQGNQAIQFKTLSVWDLASNTQVYYESFSTTAPSVIFNKIYTQFGIRYTMYLDNMSTDISNLTFRSWNGYIWLDIPQTIANKQYGNGSILSFNFYILDSSFRVSSICNKVVIPFMPALGRMVTSTTSGLKIETASSAPSGTVPVTLAFDSNTNKLYIVN